MKEIIDFFTAHSTLFQNLFWIASTFIGIREWIISRREIKRLKDDVAYLDRCMTKMANNQKLMYMEWRVNRKKKPPAKSEEQKKSGHQ